MTDGDDADAGGGDVEAGNGDVDAGDSDAKAENGDANAGNGDADAGGSDAKAENGDADAGGDDAEAGNGDERAEDAASGDGAAASEDGAAASEDGAAVTAAEGTDSPDAAAGRVGPAATDRQIAGVAGLLAVVPPVLLALGVLPFVPASTWMRTLVGFLLFALLAVALNVAFGHTDQLFLFTGALAGVGAYTAALTANALGVTAWLTLPLAALLCGAVGALVSWVAAVRRFTVILIAILTLTLQLAMHEFFVGARDVTGGSTGFPFSGLELAAAGDLVGVGRNVVLYYVLLVLLAAVLAGYVRLVDSQYGLAFAAIREDEVAAEAVGIDVVRYKTVAGFLAAALVGVVGVMLAQFNQYVSPSTFGFLEVDVVVLIMLIIGGLRTTFGPVVGAAVVTVLDELLQAAVQWRTAIFGALLIVLFLYFRSGVVPAVREYLGDEGAGGDPKVGLGVAGGRPADSGDGAGEGDP